MAPMLQHGMIFAVLHETCLHKSFARPVQPLTDTAILIFMSPCTTKGPLGTPQMLVPDWLKPEQNQVELLQELPFRTRVSDSLNTVWSERVRENLQLTAAHSWSSWLAPLRSS